MNRFVFPVSTLPGPIQALATEVENAFDQMINGTNNDGKDYRSQESTRAYTPRMNLIEYDDRFALSLDLPGVDPDKVSIELKDNRLTITGERRSPDLPEGAKAWRWENAAGEFQRVIQLPETVNTDAIDANFELGVLHVSVPKMPKPQPKKIEIRVSNTATVSTSG